MLPYDPRKYEDELNSKQLCGFITSTWFLSTDPSAKTDRDLRLGCK